MTVHPHVRGEYRRTTCTTVSALGSPPRAWGIRSVFPCHFSRCRFTPTCVGNTHASTHVPVTDSVHPHVRGEYLGGALDRQSGGGSPPRAWGIPIEILVVTLRPRFTPTCVGNTEPPRPRIPPHTVHPHVRGEYDETALGGLEVHGSPPRAWGIRVAT